MLNLGSVQLRFLKGLLAVIFSYVIIFLAGLLGFKIDDVAIKELVVALVSATLLALEKSCEKLFGCNL